MNEALANILVKRLQKEEIISVTEAAKLIPTNRGGRSHASREAVVRWIREGKRGIHLEAFQAAGKGWWTSREAVRRFLAKLTAQQSD